MATFPVYATQASTGKYPPALGNGRTSPISNPSSSTLVESTPHIRRPSIELKVSSGGPNIINSVVVDSTGRPLYSISSDSKQTKMLSHKDNFEVATIDWDHSSPRMVFRGKNSSAKIRASCSFRTLATLTCDGMRIRSRIFFHGDSQFRWMHQPSRGFLIPANRSGLIVAKWHSESLADGLRLQIFQEALVEPGLIEAIILSILLLQSGHSLGDTLESLISMSPKYYGAGNLF
ncbi:hypothetical protein EI94DRAFT_1729641, partial [Lactarius quietus]